MITPDEFTDVTYAVEEDAFAIITINRPDRMNSFRGRTVDELIYAFKHAWTDHRVAAIILTGAGEKAFCAGGDVKERAETGSYGETEWGTFEIERLRDTVGRGHLAERDQRRGGEREDMGREGSARPDPGSVRSTPASARRTSRGWWGRSGPARSGSC